MFLQHLIENLNLKVLTKAKTFSTVPVKSGYCSDLLSCVMTGAQPDGVWVTLIAHSNIIAVAALLDLAAVIITEDAKPDLETIEVANQKGVTLLSTSMDNYATVGKLWELGLKVSKE